MFIEELNNNSSEYLQHMWAFERSQPLPKIKFNRIRFACTKLTFPPWFKIINPVKKNFAKRWVLYFAYLPQGSLLPHHRYTLKKLHEQNLPVLLVCAVPSPVVSKEFIDYSDALILKGLSGYDFSAYSIGINHIASNSPGSDVLVMNDSVYGPFSDINISFDSAPWDLTGFSSSTVVENHLQSYAFILRNLTPKLINMLGMPFSRFGCFDDYRSVILNQETRFASVASKKISVGSFWHDKSGMKMDISLHCALQLNSMNFPFLKRSLLGKKIGMQPLEKIKDILLSHGHPPD